jgi:hypothetical protein
MGNSVLDAMMEAMLKNTSSKLMSGDYSQAIDESTKYLSSIEGLKPEIRTNYALIIIQLYGMRAQSQYLLWLQTKNEDMLQEAKHNIDKAIQSSEILYKSLSSENLIVLKANIRNLIHENANLRKNGLKALIEIKIGAKAATLLASNKTLFKIWPYIIFFLTGAAAWGIFPLIYFVIRGSVATSGSVSTAVAFVCGVMFFLLFMLTLKGWSWFSQYKFGSYGSFIKYMSTLFIGLTVVGLIPVCYWTGKGIFKWIDEIRG